MFNNLLFSFLELNKGSYPFPSLPFYQQNQPLASYLKQSTCTSAISINSMIKRPEEEKKREHEHAFHASYVLYTFSAGLAPNKCFPEEGHWPQTIQEVKI